MTISGGVTSKWAEIPFWAAFRRVKRTGFPNKELLSVYRDFGVVRKRDRDDNFNVESEDLNPYQLVRPGDLAINKMKAWQGSLGVSPFEGIVSPAYFVFESTSENEIRFLNHLLRSRQFAALFRALSKGIRPNQWDLDPDQLRSVKLRLPPLDEQRAIADYLDRETSQIDVLVAKQEEFIGLLRERRSAISTNALLNLPTIKLRRLVEPSRPMTYGILQAGEHRSDGIPYLGPSDLPGEGAFPILASLRRTSRNIADAYSRSTLRGGDVVVSIGPAYGRVAVTPNELSGGNLTQDTVRVALRNELADTRFVTLALGSRAVLEYWNSQIQGATFRRLNLGTLASTPIPITDLSGQRRIAREIDEAVSRIDTLITKAEEHIALAKERRAALITAAVTGQFDVRTARKAG